jgi:hypothetical protein
VDRGDRDEPRIYLTSSTEKRIIDTAAADRNRKRCSIEVAKD